MKSSRPSADLTLRRSLATPPVLHPATVLVEMLGHSLGAEVAEAAVQRATRELQLGPRISRAQALMVLEAVAQEPGIVGIAARFAKSRVHLVWGSDTASG